MLNVVMMRSICQSVTIIEYSFQLLFDKRRCRTCSLGTNLRTHQQTITNDDKSFEDGSEVIGNGGMLVVVNLRVLSSQIYVGEDGGKVE